MENRFGNWIVTEDSIELNGDFYRNIDYNIEIKRLLEFGHNDREGFYNWLIHLTEKKWIEIEDIKTLNEAFIFACEKFDLNLDWEAYEKTLDQQSIIIDNRK